MQFICYNSLFFFQIFYFLLFLFISTLLRAVIYKQPCSMRTIAQDYKINPLQLPVYKNPLHKLIISVQMFRNEYK